MVSAAFVSDCGDSDGRRELTDQVGLERMF